MMAGIDKRIQAAVDRLLIEQGSYQPVELLLQLGRLSYEGYEAWRSGDVAFLEDALSGNAERVIQQLGTAGAWASRLGLRASPAAYQGWGLHAGHTLSFSPSPDTDRLMRTQYQRAADAPPQLDLFLDSAATAHLNALADALAARNRVQAEASLEDLLAHQPDHHLRPVAEQLYDALSHLARTPELDDAIAELAYLESGLAPRAREFLGNHRSRDFLAPFWRRLARSLEGRPFDPARDHAHPSWAYAQCLDWQGVRESILATAGHEAQPTLLGRLAEACQHLGQRAEAIGHWSRLCWQHPDHARRLFDAPEFPDLALRKAWDGFQDLDFEPEPMWLPAWLLLNEPGLAHTLPADLAGDRPGPERAFRLITALLNNPNTAPEEGHMRLRRALQAESADFLVLYLRRRPPVTPAVTG